MFLLVAQPVFAMDVESLSKRISESVASVANRKYATVAFSRISGPLDKATTNELIDYTNVTLVKSRKFRVIDRSKLNLILAEQSFNLSGMVSQNTYKELGKLLGVDLFIYGRYYNDTLVMKGIDVESSAIVWADIFQLTSLTVETKQMSELAGKMTASLKNDLKRLKNNKINQISFWNIKSNFKQEKLIDFLSTALTKDGHFQVVDRENLALILEEQKLSMAEFIDENKVKKMGELYGVDAFIYGKIAQKSGKQVASLKLLNIFNGVIEWADLIHIGDDKSEKSRGVERSNESSNQVMIMIPNGQFTMGSDHGTAINQPQFRLNIKDFYIDKKEVSNKDYARYLKRFRRQPPPNWIGGVIPPGKENFPVTMITWVDADRFCLSEGKRLPKEVEWEKAYRGRNGFIFPWGNQAQSGYATTVENEVLGPVAVDGRTEDISPFGVYHMAGNVREWIGSKLKPYPRSPYQSAKVNHERVIRGGSWAKTMSDSAGWMRESSKETFAWKDVGFRCAKSSL
ncbi:MAG: SUMF1/EgtB/PvdO family nonheme iron enzyme [SAR324 cluster bacterium]|nr:SUMF1/EgtB/PvdO family nonheme iron enzyme [SAR324 cluster bacterium]